MPAGHEAAPVPGTIYSAGPNRAGIPADLRYRNHYPVVAICMGCRDVIRLEHYVAIGEGGEWQHTGRKAGEPG